MIYRGIIFVTFIACTISNIFAAKQDAILRTYKFEMPVVIEQPDITSRIEMDNTRPDDLPAKPILPIFSTSIDIPEGFIVDAVTLNTTAPALTIALPSPVMHAQPYFKPGTPPAVVVPDPLVYENDADYPTDHRLLWRTDPTGESLLLSISFTPLQYNPVQKLLLYQPEISLSISLSRAPVNTIGVISKLDTTPSPLNPEERCDYLIISTSNLIAQAAPPWDFTALLDRREHSGLTTKILPIEWIYANYSGADQPEQIRHFLQDAHDTWNLKYLLIAGTHQMIPTRLLYIRVPTFFLDYIEYIPADHIYYGCMGGSYDGNGNGLYGEYNDGDSGGDVDLTAEILVGRFPVENKTELSHMVRKTLHYELAPATDFYNNGFISEKVDFGNIIYGEPFMEHIRNGSTTSGHNTLGYENSPYTEEFSTTNNLHDNTNYLFTSTDVLNYLTNNLHSINHLGHGAKWQCLKLNVRTAAQKEAIAALNNPFPYVFYSQACLSGAYDADNCFAEHFVTVSNAAVATVMNSRNGWASPTSVNGISHTFHRYFWDSGFRGKATTLGEMDEAARRANLSSVPSFNGSLNRWVYYTLNLLGDPAMPLMPAILNVPPSSNHTPLINTYNTSSNYVINCKFEPIGIFDPNSIFSVWSSNGGECITQKMTHVVGNQYEIPIPPQTVDTRIDYLICSSNYAGYTSLDPVSDTHTFYVTDELSLLIAGSPSNVGEPTPEYGLHSSASGLVINASAEEIIYESEDMRYINKGFFGTGSVPQESTNQLCSFRMDVDSILIWRWQREHRFQINSDISIPAESTHWTEDGTQFTPPPAPLFVIDTNTNRFAFAGWKLDGIRSPALPQSSTPQHPAIPANTHHELTATYIPATQDSDENGIEDWWEMQYFGAPGVDIYADHDDDGYDIYEEFEDRSDPLDPLSLPAPPSITHTPLVTPADKPGPYTISALITDTHSVTNAEVIWWINGGALVPTALTLTSNNIYEATIAPETAPGDLISYFITVADPSGNVAVTSTHNVFLAYPVADYSMLEDILVVTQPGFTAITNTSLIINRGNTPLNWSISSGLAERFTSDNMNALLNWDTSSIEQPWAISTNHSASTPYAMHAQLVSTKGSSHHASITLPPLLIGTDATLSFSYWINSEIYSHDPIRAFDAGIVEYSTDGGATFNQLSGPYTHEVYGWSMSPWPDKTPCFAGLSFGWKRAIFNLTELYPDSAGFEGESVIFRFVYGGDDNTDLEGWYIDDIRVSPASLPAGFSYVLPEPNPFTTSPGYYSELLWRNLPSVMDSRTEGTTIFFDSNAPINASGSFQWQALIRETPQINLFGVSQVTNGNGVVAVDVTTREKDNEPLALTLEWSVDRGHNWYNSALTNITFSPQHLGTPDYASDGVIANIPGTTNSIPVTNAIAAVWNSKTPETNIGWVSNVYMRLTASSPWFTTNATAIFPIDNIAPLFTEGDLTAQPQGKCGDYLVAEEEMSLDWPIATDIPANNTVNYKIFAETNLLATCTNLTQTLINITNYLDSTATISVFPIDPLGNAGTPLELTTLILNADSDYDSDGMVTSDEESAGTDASDQQSIFIISSFAAIETNQLSISWTSVLNRSYTVETSSTLTPPAWTSIPALSNIQGTGEIITREIPLSGSNAFYRVQVER